MELSTEAKPMQFGISALETALIAITGFGAMQKLPELAAALDVVVSGNPKIILEIGFGKGGTSWAWSKIPSLEKLIVVNMPDGPWGGQGNDEHVLKHISDYGKATVHYIAGNSQNSGCLDAVKSTLGEEKLDVLFIDGLS